MRSEFDADHNAVLGGVKLSEMRSRFVSSVTYELKTPHANIHALADTLARQSPMPPGRYREYPNLLMQQTKHFSRLVDNLLDYAWITDVSETYAFEPMAAAELVYESAEEFPAATFRKWNLTPARDVPGSPILWASIKGL
jgi:signal transduction histidine kinase